MNKKRNEPYAAIKKPVELLFGSSADTTQPDNQANASSTIDITKIKLPSSQPRRYFDPQKLEELSRSVKELGILEPLLVRPLSGGDYELVAGERRYRAATMAGLIEVPIVAREMDDATTYQVRLVENLQREDLNPLEETEGILELLALRLEISVDETVKLLQKMDNEAKGKITRNVTGNSQTLLVEEVFIALGRMKWDSFVRNRLPLLGLPPDVLSVLRSGKLEYTKARAIARVKNEKIRDELLNIAIEHNLSLSEIKQKIQVFEQQSESRSSSQTETTDLKERVDDTLRRFKKAKLWDDPKKKTQVEKLLAQLEALMQQN
ncbi:MULTISPECIES: ParB/RepB/Spo0J family partition protein [unclassified Tolypothrix]|uniref:ParB/RepB/Spo0J family partition protein n=1 Tax=unclassified Tolypothrix TaxID=2649714 RepID=UPI0005EAA4F5|nr:MULTISPECIES: ParB/RepB/Spo0J family partition protein [unclassified Tolypothrix]BAY95352.1 ParB family protein [Microchaete diplosiphon NIES-3275]EKE96465.1 partitioning protein ParB [Tolypothrix sp. PCC 7601]MBE9087046.1 ParB/RepB/Spo0J family partition protein [Tolypothrix sp. LEGE 11397]UYD30566.1 ParB/RepB/Spo0J family partition protein [Tolypothrix sp. PCC 7712]UYD38302.1 ParB/RepB/Spo0J family partition protein [Tolypothrix sp. PCC 7601]